MIKGAGPGSDSDDYHDKAAALCMYGGRETRSPWAGHILKTLETSAGAQV